LAQPHLFYEIGASWNKSDSRANLSSTAESGFGSALAILKKPRLHGALAAVAFTIVLS
jgi:hypothetical protein